MCINSNLPTFFFFFHSPLCLSPRHFENSPTPPRWSKKQGIHLDTTPSHLAAKGSTRWMDRLKNIAAMLDTDQHSHSIIISLMIAHECFWMLHLAPRMMEVVVYIQAHFPGCQKLHSEKAVLLSSRVIIYLSKQGSSPHVGGSLGL